jgi:hypothetical protein
MKNIINSIFARFGFAPLFQLANFKKAKKNYADLISVEQQAIAFVQNSLELINNAIRSELKRNGYNPEDVLSGKVFLKSSAVTSKIDDRFKRQIYMINGFVILRVNWKPNGFTLETNTMDVVRINKEKLKQNIENSYDVKALERKEKYDVNLDALTNKKIIENKTLKAVK